MAGGRPLKFQSPEELYKKGIEYFDMCSKSRLPLTVTGLALHLDTTRDTLMDYQEKDEFSDTIKRLKLFCENYAEKKLYESNATGPIFALKNFGWKDKQEVDSRIQSENYNVNVEADGDDVDVQDIVKEMEQRMRNKYSDEV